MPQPHRFGHPWPNIKRRVAALPARQEFPLPPRPLSPAREGGAEGGGGEAGRTGPSLRTWPAGRHSSRLEHTRHHLLMC